MEATAENQSTRAIKYRLVGEVQGVGFRGFIKSKAQEFDLSGFASNEADGSLAVLLIGDDEQIGRLQPFLYQGPPGARVVTVTEILPEDEDITSEAGFSIR